MVIIHAQAPVTPLQIPDNLLSKRNFIVLAGPRRAFDALELQVTPGQPHGRVLQVEQVQPCYSAFEVLADCARLFQRLLAEHLTGLGYLQPAGDPSRGEDMTAGSVNWSSNQDGAVDRFDLSPAVACSPLLAPLTSKLAARPLNDNRRFALLAAAFAGA